MNGWLKPILGNGMTGRRTTSLSWSGYPNTNVHLFWYIANLGNYIARDIFAGLTLASISIPMSLSYAAYIPIEINLGISPKSVLSMVCMRRLRRPSSTLSSEKQDVLLSSRKPLCLSSSAKQSVKTLEKITLPSVLPLTWRV
jgi:hypothetical protein